MMADLHKGDSPFLHLDRSLPMIYPPAPWEDPEVGGYYLRPTNLIRQTDTPSIASKCADLTKLYQIVDTIGKVPWQINTKVL
jgi:DNA-directed RNA polymerase